MVLFGVSNRLSDIIEIVNARGKRVRKIVLNMPEEKRPRTKDLDTRLRELRERPMILSLNEFIPQQGDEYFVVPVTPKKYELISLLIEKYGLHFARLVHPTAFISPYTSLGQGVFVGACSVVGPGCVLEDHVSIGRGVTVGHDVILHPYVRVNPGSNIAGHVEVFDGALVGLGASIIEELVVGRNAVVAAGAVVLKDVPERTLVAGVPAVAKKVYDN
ncbi:MAG: hypothetical protein M0042_00035 [Nitrospiraceae bacterium]|nr:hypothetical protein [Nitrospiraceae bacterium]